MAEEIDPKQQEEEVLSKLTDKAEAESDAQAPEEEIKSTKPYKPSNSLPKWALWAFLGVLMLGLAATVWWLFFKENTKQSSVNTSSQEQQSAELESTQYERIFYVSGADIFVTTESGSSEKIYTLKDDQELINVSFAENEPVINIAEVEVNAQSGKVIKNVLRYQSGELTTVIDLSSTAIGYFHALNNDVSKIAVTNVAYPDEGGIDYFNVVYEADGTATEINRAQAGSPLLRPIGWHGDDVLMQEITCIQCDGPSLPTLWKVPSGGGEPEQLFELDNLTGIQYPSGSFTPTTDPNVFYLEVSQHTLGGTYDELKETASYLYRYEVDTNNLTQVYSTSAGDLVKFLGLTDDKETILIETAELVSNSDDGFSYDFENRTISRLNLATKKASAISLELSIISSGGFFETATLRDNIVYFNTARYGENSTLYKLYSLDISGGENAVEEITSKSILFTSSLVRTQSILFGQSFAE